MFALLQHDTGSPAQSGPRVHWDFLIEVPGLERLPTWRLERNPIGCPDEIVARRIGDHRRAYLEYEGKISGGRGAVRRLDRGQAIVRASTAETIVAKLAGTHLRGTYEITPGPSGGLVFRLGEPDAPPDPRFPPC